MLDYQHPERGPPLSVGVERPLGQIRNKLIFPEEQLLHFIKLMNAMVGEPIGSLLRATEQRQHCLSVTKGINSPAASLN